MFVENEWLRGTVDSSGSHFPVILLASIYQFDLAPPLGLILFSEIVLEQVAIILKKEYILDCPFLHAKMDGLVCLCIFDVLNGHKLLRLSPIPEWNRAIHVISQNMFTIYAWLSYPIQQTTYPFWSPDSAGVSRQYEFLAIREKLNVISRRCDKIDIDWFFHSYVMFDYCVRNRDNVGRYRVSRYCERWGLVAFERDGFVFHQIE